MNNNDYYNDNYYKELAHMITEAGESQYLQGGLASRKLRRAPTHTHFLLVF